MLKITNFQPDICFDNSNPWFEVRDGNKRALELYERHYSCYRYADGRKRDRFVGPGQRLVLLSYCGNALFVWRKFRSMDGQAGINCAVFRNETAQRSSGLILAAEKLAFNKWGEFRGYTYINQHKIKSRNPGYCFKCAGWRLCGRTKKRKLLILEKDIRG